jgi:hypothetical protein
MVLVMFAKDADKADVQFTTTKIDYLGSKHLAPTTYSNIANMIMLSVSRCEMHFDPRPIIIIEWDPEIKKKLKELEWYLPKENTTTYDLVKTTGIPCSVFCRGEWIFGTKRVIVEQNGK